MPGPPPKPTEQKRVLGNPGKRALGKPAVALAGVPAGHVPRPPKNLGRAGRSAWRELWQAAAAWLSPVTDRRLMERLCRAYDEIDDWRAILDRDGLTSNGSRGQLVVHPAVQTMRVLEAQITRWEALCGFTPADRSRLGMAEVTRVSKLDELLAKRRPAA